MTSRRDRVVRARTAPDTTMPEQLSRKVFTWVSMANGNSCTMCAVIFPWWTRNIRTMSGSIEADPCSNSDRCSGRVRFNRIDQWSTASDLTDCDRWTGCSWSEGIPVWPMPKDRCPEYCKGDRSGNSSALSSGLWSVDWMFMVWRDTGVTDAQRPMSGILQRKLFGELICTVIWTVIGGLDVHGLKGYRCDRCPKTDVRNTAKETVRGTHLHCHLDCDRWTGCSWSEGIPVWPMPKDRCPEYCKGNCSGNSSALSSGLWSVDWMFMVWRDTGVTDAQRPMSGILQRKLFGELICTVIWTVRVQ